MQASKSNSLSKKTLIHHSLLIQGMTCASCVARIEKSLQKISGVQHATVNLATETATIQSTSNVTDEQLIAAVQKIGYQATLSNSQFDFYGIK
jgi:copper chaperone CopZ